MYTVFLASLCIVMCYYAIKGGGIMKNNRDKRISANVTEELYQKFVAEADKQGRSISNLLTHIIKEYLNSR